MSEHQPCWMVERQAFGGAYWEKISFGPFDTHEEAEAFTDSPFGGFVYDANARIEHLTAEMRA